MLLLHIISFTQPDQNNTGYAVLSRNLARALTELQSDRLRVLLSNRADAGGFAANRETSARFPGDVLNLVISVGPDSSLLGLLHGRNAFLTMFERDMLPAGWAAGLNLADLVVTPSRWGRDVMVTCGVQQDKIQVIPLGVDGNLYHPWGSRLAELPAGGTFKFLAVGKYEKRKGYDQILQAFAEEFAGDESVQLYLKADHFHDPAKNRVIDAEVLSRGIRNLFVIKGEISEAAMAQLYRSVDAFLFPSLGEGFGLPLIEAIACGVPAIATSVTGHSEFLADEQGRFREVSARLQPADPTPDCPDSRWWVPDVGSLRAAMRDSVEHPSRANAVSFAVDVIARYSWEAAAHRLIYAAQRLFGRA